MDLLWGLKDKLSFVTWMYDEAVLPFAEMKRKIETSEGEFDESGLDPDDFGGAPPFLEQWQNASEALNVLGQACLSLVKCALTEYLDGCIMLAKHGKPQKKGRESWFEAYRRFFGERLGIDWGTSPVDLRLIEEINLARNAIQHEGKEFGMDRYHEGNYHLRFPDSVFLDTTLLKFLPRAARVSVDSDALRLAMTRVTEFCSFVEEERLRRGINN